MKPKVLKFEIVQRQRESSYGGLERSEIVFTCQPTTSKAVTALQLQTDCLSLAEATGGIE